LEKKILTMLKPNENPLLKVAVTAVDVEKLTVPTVFSRPRRDHKRKLRDARRAQSAREAIAGLDRKTELYGFTKGQFSLLDLIVAVLDLTGPVHLTLSTWTAALAEIGVLVDLLQRGSITGTRWLIDFSLARRDPAVTASLMEKFGKENVRVCQNHSKFAIFQNAKWAIVCRSSMNLNKNPRMEDFTIAHDPKLAKFLNSILDDIWSKQKSTMIDEKPYEIVKHCQEDL
jgi:hypothetical protein